MPALLRNALALVAGFVAGAVVNSCLVMLGPLLVPPPAGVDPTNAASLAQGIHLFEPKHFLFPFLAHALGTLVGAAVAYALAVSRRPAFGYAVGVLFLAGGVAASRMIPAPAWFVALDLVVAYLPMAWLGNRLGARLAPRAAPAPAA